MSAIVGRASANYVKPLKLSRFVDSVRVKFRGGDGGDGCISMLSLFANEFAGPDGGNGGNGGHVVLKANRQIKSLNAVRSLYSGDKGERGQGKNQYGVNAKHLFVEVPVGTVVCEPKPKDLADHEFDPDKSDTVAELDQDGSLFIAARGGAGGKGNNYFLSNSNRHPRVAQAGAKGEETVYELRMRYYAHVGLIGLPNAGKSTLLRTMTHASVKIGDYAFTTLYPQVGVIEYDDYTQIAISDLPGLIEDSHRNRGLGVAFLRNVQRCVCLLYVIDLTDEPVRQFETLVRELELTKRGLSCKPHIVLANKVDDPRADANIVPFTAYLAEKRPKTKLLVGSTKRGDNLEILRHELRQMYDQYESSQADGLDTRLVW